MSILNKYKRWNPKLVIITNNIFDFVLSKNSTKSNFPLNKLTEKCLSAYIDINNDLCIENESLVSLGEYSWEGSKSSDIILSNIGFTGIDNGLIKYNKQVISNNDFLKILTKSTYSLYNNDKRLKLHPVHSNSQFYDYSYSFSSDENNKYVSLYGGFFQGFFKLSGHDYEVLPNKINDAWGIEFTIRPKDYEEKYNTLNSIHPNNNGIFFYMGTRAENKFLQLYSYDLSSYEKRYVENVSNEIMCENFYDGYYFFNNENYEEEKLSTPSMHNLRNMLDIFYNSQENWISNCGCNKNITNDDSIKNCDSADKNYFIDSYYATICQKDYFDENYILKDINLDSVIIEDSNGNAIETNGYYEIETDNKFLIFNNTKDGFNTKTWDDDFKFILTGISKTNNYNLFLLLNKTKTGYTTDTIHKFFNSESIKTPNLKQDIINNAFALKINEDGSLGYRYLINDCDSNIGYKIEEEKGFPGLIKNNEWNTIFVKIVRINGLKNECNSLNKNEKMKILIYVNGYLKFISKELPMFNFRKLNESDDKQEGVPFNISLGGGTQGLCDSIWVNYYKPFEHILPIEEHFAGTFIGDIKSFRFYDCDLEYNEIKNNFAYEQSLLK